MDVAALFNQAFSAVNTAGFALADIFKEEGLILLSVGASGTALWLLLRDYFLASDTVKFLVSLFNLILRMGVVLVIVQSMNGVPRDMFVTATKEASTKITQGSANPVEILKLTMDTISLIADGKRKESEKSLYCKMHGGWSLNPLDWIIDSRPAECVNKDQIGFFEILKNLPLILVIFLCQILAIIAMVLMSIAFIVVLQMSYVMLQLGLALGPLLVGLSIIPAVSFLFDGWLRVMIAASLQQLVAWFVAVLITKGVVPTLVSFYDKIDSRKEADLYFASNEIAMIAIALLGFIAAYMMWQVPGLAQALVAGGSANAQSFGRGMVGRGMAAKILRSGGKR